MSRLLKQRYFIIDELGRGGMGVLYKARDIQLGGRLVAVKEMSQDELRPDQIVAASQAFEQEALMLAHLMHPHLPSIHEHFAEAGCWYLVMEFIDGQALEDYRRAQGGKLLVEEVLDSGMQLCSVLDYLHTRQPSIIFRDLKPRNIMRTPDGHLYLIDFGIARHFKRDQARDTAIAYSKGYAAPEQYGETQTTARSDIYSLGATLHHLLSGNHPALTPFRFTPIPAQGETKLSQLNTLIMQMVEMDESKRPPSMAEVKLRLQRIAAQQATGQISSSRSGGKTPLIPKQQAPVHVAPSSASRLSQSGILPATAPSSSQSLQRPISRRSVLIAVAGVVAAGGGITVTVELVNKFNYDQNHLLTLETFTGQSGTIYSVAWSPDGKRIASSGDNVQVWKAS